MSGGDKRVREGEKDGKIGEGSTCILEVIEFIERCFLLGGFLNFNCCFSNRTVGV